MALFRWLAHAEGDDLPSALTRTMEGLGLNIIREFSSPDQLCASEHEACGASAVKVIVTWSDRNCRELLIETFSSEPLLRPHSRCRSLVSQLQRHLPPLAQ